MRPSSRHRTDTERRAPIRWSKGSSTAERILQYCEYEVNRLRRQIRTESRRSTRYLEARIAILERIHGNLRNINRRAYPSEIRIETLEGDLTRWAHLDSSSRLGILDALESEWDDLRSFFERNFIEQPR